jgi:hypothetical protein
MVADPPSTTSFHAGQAKKGTFITIDGNLYQVQLELGFGGYGALSMM